MCRSDRPQPSSAPSLSRRELLRAGLKAGGLSLLAWGVGPAFLGRTALASPGPAPLGRRKVLVTLFQRGAMDGLAAVPLLGDPHLAELRPRLALPSRVAGSLSLDGRFGLHPALEPLHRHFRDGSLAVVHAVGSPSQTRSHFDAQDYMESGTPGDKTTQTGWLNRVMGELGHEAPRGAAAAAAAPADDSPFRAVSLTPALPRSLYGPEPALAVARLEHLALPGAARLPAARSGGFEALYRETTAELLADTGRESFDALRILEDKNLLGEADAPGVDYPATRLGRSLRQIARLIKADVGLEVAFTDSGGWDTHVGQGAGEGTFALRAGDLARSIDAFWKDLGARRSDVVLLTMTEFGRTVRENGSGGTDHGHGSCLFVLGESVAGGKVYGKLEGLSPDLLHDGRDLPVTTDFRSVFREVAGRHLGVPGDAEIFPGWSGPGLPLFRRG